jgi:hypothetical protein
MKSNHILAAVGCVFVLSACGGGGGGAGGGGAAASAAASTPAPTVTASAISSVDASRAAENSYSAGYLVSTWSSAVPNLLNGVSVAPVDAGLVAPVFDLVAHAYSQDGAGLLTGAVNTYSCTGGGWMEVNATQHDPRTPTIGDTWTFTGHNCVANSITENGSISMKVTDASGNVFQSTSGTMTLDIVFNNFSTQKDVMLTTASGDMKLSVNETDLTNSTFAISGAQMLETVQQSGATLSTRTLSSYSASGSRQGSQVTASANFSLSGQSNRLGQFTYTVKNVQPFVTTSGSLPTSGALIVTGAASSVTATVTATGIRLDHSDNANGTITSTSTRTWDEFLSDY